MGGKGRGGGRWSTIVGRREEERTGAERRGEKTKSRRMIFDDSSTERIKDLGYNRKGQCKVSHDMGQTQHHAQVGMLCSN